MSVCCVVQEITVMLEAEKAQMAAKHEEHVRGFEGEKKSVFDEHEALISVLQADLHEASRHNDALAADHEQLVVDHEQVRQTFFFGVLFKYLILISWGEITAVLRVYSRNSGNILLSWGEVTIVLKVYSRKMWQHCFVDKVVQKEGWDFFLYLGVQAILPHVCMIICMEYNTYILCPFCLLDCEIDFGIAQILGPVLFWHRLVEQYLMLKLNLKSLKSQGQSSSGTD